MGSSRDYELWSNGDIIRAKDAYTYWQGQLEALLEGLGDECRPGGPARGDAVPRTSTRWTAWPTHAVPPATHPASLVIDADYAALESAAAEAAGASVLSLNGVLCPGRSCPVVVDDMVVFRDQHHLTASYMERLAGARREPARRPGAVPHARAVDVASRHRLTSPRASRTRDSRSARQRPRATPHPHRGPVCGPHPLVPTRSVMSDPGPWWGLVRFLPVAYPAVVAPPVYPCVAVAGSPDADESGHADSPNHPHPPSGDGSARGGDAPECSSLPHRAWPRRTRRRR